MDLLLFNPHRDQYSDEAAGSVLGPCLTTPPCGHIGKVYLLLAEIHDKTQSDDERDPAFTCTGSYWNIAL
ncbi:UNVERIFIED_CONTAM: hypothetical protein FKN15_072037 [Acipenser sinensis]